jgi:hypothetical protein
MENQSMTAATKTCWSCERVHEPVYDPDDVCENDRAAIYQELIAAISDLADAPPEAPGVLDRSLVYARAQLRLAQLQNFDALDAVWASIQARL